MRNLLSLLVLAANAASLHAQTTPDIPLNERVMVVYNASGEASHKVANYYAEKRNIPKANICRINTFDLDAMNEFDVFVSEVKKPIRSCLERIGKQKILYIVMAYQTPFRTSAPNPTGEMLNGMGIDSLISDIWDEFAGAKVIGRYAGNQPYFGNAQSQGNAYEPYVSFAKYRDQPGAKTIYSVWRLDGPNPEIAMGLVDKALYAEEHGLKGKAYFDIRGPIDTFVDNGYGAGEWDIYRASQMAQKASFDVTLDELPSEFGTAPSQMKCENAALYAGWYSLGHYNDVFTWAPGAIGFHTDSASATSTRAGTSWVTGALHRGITVTSGSVTEPYLEGLVHPDQIFFYLFQGANVGDAVFRATRWIKWMILNVGDPLYRPFPKGAGPFASTLAYPESWFGIIPNTVVGGATVRGQLSLVGKHDKTLPVTFSSSHPDLVTLPSGAAIPVTANGAQFPITVKGPDQPASIVITVSVGNEKLANTLNVYPILANLTLSQPSIKSAETVKATVTLSGPARGPGVVVKLSSNREEAILPGELTIAAGSDKGTFSISGKLTQSEVTATITAKVDNASKTAQLKITP